MDPSVEKIVILFIESVVPGCFSCVVCFVFVMFMFIIIVFTCMVCHTCLGHVHAIFKFYIYNIDMYYYVIYITMLAFVNDCGIVDMATIDSFYVYGLHDII